MLGRLRLQLADLVGRGGALLKTLADFRPQAAAAWDQANLSTTCIVCSSRRVATSSPLFSNTFSIAGSSKTLKHALEPEIARLPDH